LRGKLRDEAPMTDAAYDPAKDRPLTETKPAPRPLRPQTEGGPVPIAAE
jgi:hypothetical protein